MHINYKYIISIHVVFDLSTKNLQLHLIGDFIRQLIPSAPTVAARIQRNMKAAFATAAAIRGNMSARRRPVCRCARAPQMALSATTLALDCIAVAAVAAGVVYATRARIAAPPDEERAADEKTPTVPADEGILGLSSRSTANGVNFSTSPAVFAGWRSLQRVVPVPTVPDAKARRTEELAWASGVLSDLGDVSAVVFDASGRVLHADGALVRAETTEEVGPFVKRVLAGESEEVLEVDGAADVPFLTDDVRSVAVYPVGDGALVVAAAESGFFEVREKRIAAAVAGRLAAFVGTAGADHVR